MAGRYFSCSCLTTKIVSVVPLPGTNLDWHQLSDEAQRPSTILSRTFMTCSVRLIVVPFQCIPLNLVEGDNETLLQVRGYLAIANDCSCKVMDHGGAHVTDCSYHLHHYDWWARCFARLHLRDSLLNHISGYLLLLSKVPSKKKILYERYQKESTCSYKMLEQTLNNCQVTVDMLPLNNLLNMFLFICENELLPRSWVVG